MGDVVAIVVVVVLAVLIGGSAAASARARRRLRRDALDVPALVAGRLSGPSRPDVVDGAVRTALGSSTHDGSVLEAVSTALDPAALRPKLGQDVEYRTFRLRWGNDYAMIANTRRLLHFELDADEAALLPLMDGTRTVREIVVDRLHETGDLDVSEVVDLVDTLRRGHLLEPDHVDVDEVLEDRLDPEPRSRRMLRKFLSTLTLDWEGAEGFVRALYRRGLRVFFTRAGVIVSVAVAIAGLAALAWAISSGRFSLPGQSPPATALILIALGFVLTFAHELGHALVLIHRGRRIRSAGFMIYFGSPAFFVDATEALMLDRRDRIVQAFGGPFAELVLAGLGAIALALFPSSPFAPVLYTFSVLNYFEILLNLIPLLELDGYFILAELIQVPDLRSRSMEFVQHDMWHKLRTRRGFTPQEVGLALYGVVGVLFTIATVWVGLIFWQKIFGGLVSSAWSGGWGSRLVLVALILFLAGPALRGLGALARTIQRRVARVIGRIRFRLETGWRVEAARMVDALPAFEDLSGEVLSDLAGRVRLVRIGPGGAVFRQGDRPTAFYVVRRGTVRIEEEDPDTGETRTIATLSPGAAFGELGLLEARPRTATARAEDEAELFEIPKSAFDRLLADEIDAPRLAPTIQALVELRDLPTFRHLSGEELRELLERGSWINAGPGEALVREGERGTEFFVIASGRALVTQHGIEARELGPGAHFGELALLRDAPRSASVTAATPMRLFRLSADGFHSLVADAFRKGVLRLPTDRTLEH